MKLNHWCFLLEKKRITWPQIRSLTAITISTCGFCPWGYNSCIWVWGWHCESTDAVALHAMLNLMATHTGEHYKCLNASTFKKWAENISFMFAVKFNDLWNQQTQKSPPFARYQVEIISFYIHCLPFYLLHLRLFRNALGCNTLKLLKEIALSSA